MTLCLEDKWIWDFWLAREGPDYHVFYLQAPRSLGDPELRHWNVSVGHAVSRDPREWDVLPDTLQPSADESDAFDSRTTWTGSIIRHKGLWYLFYTGGRASEGGGLIQRIGLATSTDLMRWQKHPDNPLIEADSRWYELLDLDVWDNQAWRAPWVLQHPDRGDFHAFITARVVYGPSSDRGVIAHAQSKDLIDWEVPLPRPGRGTAVTRKCPSWLMCRDGTTWCSVCSGPSTPPAGIDERGESRPRGCIVGWLTILSARSRPRLTGFRWRMRPVRSTQGS